MTRADVVFRGGTVWLGPDRRTTALAIADGRIVGLGEAAAGAAAEQVVDLAGGLLLPAFSDGHAHPVFGGLERQGPDISALGSAEAIVAEIGRWAREHPEFDWIRAASYDPALVPGGMFRAEWLDAAVPDRPVLVRAHDYHTVWCNTEALRRAGVTADTPEPVLGHIDRDPDGTPSGTLREWHACDLVFRVAPRRPAPVLAEGLAEACRAMNRYGITWMQDAWVDEGMHRPYLDLLGRDRLTVRSNLAFRADPDAWRDQLDLFVAQRREVEAAGRPELLTARTVKFFADGVIESGTGSMLEPYVGGHDHGMAVWAPDAMAEAVRAFDALGFQTHVHAIGDAAVRTGLDAVEGAIAANPAWDRRPTMTHLQVVAPSDIPRFARLGVIADWQALWACPDPLQEVLTAPRLGPERTARQYPLASIAATGARLSMASDWPVSSNAPLEAIRVAVTRQTPEGHPAGGWLPHERIGLARALEAYTAGTAYQGYTEAYRGTIAVGKRADLAVLDRDVTVLPPGELLDAVTVSTWLDGREVFTV